jgi:uncharacterized protein (TIGR00730 family)
MSKRVCIYCSSSNLLESKYVKAAKEFAQAASLLGFTVVCGGSIRGLMGTIIDTMLCGQEREGSKGSVEGVIPGFMGDLELHHPKIKNLVITGTMSERKELLRDNTDAVVAFPGGLGTLEELLETFTLKRLGRYDGAVILFNQDGFYNHLLELLDKYVELKMMNSNYRQSLIVVSTVEELVQAICASKREKVDMMHYLPK